MKDPEYEPSNEEIESVSLRRKPKQSSKSIPKKSVSDFERKEKLALVISKYPHIYDIANANYADKQLERNTWEKIAKETKSDVVKCKQDWESNARLDIMR